MRNKIYFLASRVILAGVLLAACAPTAPTPEKIIQTVEVIETQIVEVASTPIVVTATPPPEPTEASLKPVSPEFKNPDTYVIIGGLGEPTSLDPAWMYSDFTFSGITPNIYEGLVWYNRDKDDEYVPALATEWITSPDGLTWTFTIRKGVTFHEGGTLEPHDVAYTLWRFILQGRRDGPWPTYDVLFGADLTRDSIKEFAAALEKKDSFEALSPSQLKDVCEQVKAKVVSDDEAGTVTFHLAQITPWIMDLMARNYMGMIVDQEWMVKNGDWDGSCDTWTKWADPPAEETLLFNKANGTGPYKLDHWTPGEEIVLVANEGYWRTEPMWEGGPSGAPQIKRVVFKNIPEWDTRLAMFEAGDADWIYVPPEDRAQLYPYAKEYCSKDGATCEEANPQGYIRVLRDLLPTSATAAQFNWQINVEGGNPYIGSGALDGNGIPSDFFQDIHIRKAFNYCFDFQAMIKNALFGEGIQAQGPIPKGMRGYREGEAPLYSYDPAKCEEEFKLADVNKNGKPASEDPQDVWDMGFYMQIPYNTGNDTRRLPAEIIKAGIEAVNPKFSVQVLAMPWPVMLESRRQRMLPVYVGGWGESYHDPGYWVQPFLYSEGSYGRVINMTDDYQAKYDQWIFDEVMETDPEKRRPIFETIQLAVQEDAVNIWMYQSTYMIPVQLWIKGVYYNPAYMYWQEAYSWVYALSKEAP